MRITSVELHPANSSTVVVMSFRDPTGVNPYNVRAISGLDADEIVHRNYGNTDGSSRFHNMTLEKREIVARVQLNPRFDLDESYSTLRDALYKLISSSRTGLVQIQFKDGATTVAAISGFVRKLEPTLFEKSPEVSITINCDDDPILRALDPIEVPVDDMNPALTVIEDDLSTAAHGFKFELDVISSVDSLRITDPFDDSWSFETVPVGGLVIGDIIHFSSEYKNVYLYVLRGVTEIHLADVILPGSVWPILFPEQNTFSVTDSPSFVWRAISHYPTYWGV